MDTFKATSKYSNINIMNLSNIEKLTDAIIIQIAACEILNSDFTKFYVEYVTSKNIENYQNERSSQRATASAEQADKTPAKTDEQMQLENDLETILNTDPFKNKHSGKTLKYIFENDPDWIEYAIDHMNNTFILNKLKNIKRSKLYDN